MENIDTTNWSYPQAPSTVRGRATHLTSSKDGKKFAYGSGNNVIVRESGVSTKLHYNVNFAVESLDWIQVLHPEPNCCHRCWIRAQGRENRPWNHEREEQMVSFESDPLQTRINDIAWTDCGEKFAVIGEGQNT